MRLPTARRTALLTAGLLALPLTTAGPAPASAGWSVPGAGVAAAAASTLEVLERPDVLGSGLPTTRTFTLRWTAPPEDGVPVSGYVVHRNSSLLGAGLVTAGSCTGVTVLGVVGVITDPVRDGSTLSCTDTSLVPLGTVRYTVTPVFQRWTGDASQWSDPAT